MKRIILLSLAVMLSACSDLSSKEVSGHIYESVLIQLNKHDDIELFNLASLAMSDGVMSEEEAKRFFDYARENFAPIVMAPVYSGVGIKEAYPLDKHRFNLQSFFEYKSMKKE